MTENQPVLSSDERQVYIAEWEYIVQRARYLSKILGFPNPFPTRKERREAAKVDQKET